jgi:hypothetical protein
MKETANRIVKVYRILLWLNPSRFPREYGEEMKSVF